MVMEIVVVITYKLSPQQIGYLVDEASLKVELEN